MSPSSSRTLLLTLGTLAALAMAAPIAGGVVGAAGTIAPPASDGTLDAPVEQGWLATDFADALLESDPTLAANPYGILVDYADGTTDEQRADVRARAGVALARTFPGLGDLELVETTRAALDGAIVALRGEASVVTASRDESITPDAVDPGSGNQWDHAPWPGENLPALRGSADVVVAVIDDGIDLDHPDLVNAMWTNPGEVAGNLVDDDGNGYVDDVHGWDFANGDNDPDSTGGHGIHVAGIIGATFGNGIGGYGVAAGVTIMPLRFIGDGGSGWTSDALSALNYAVAKRVRISNNSWGGGGASQSLQAGIEAAGAAGHLFVTAAGNDAKNIDLSPSYPAAYAMPNVIAVAATTQNGSLASFSNYGATGVDLAAPGQSIYATYKAGGHAWMSGTSMASPQVAGAAALLLSHHPALTTAQLRSALLTSVRPVAGLQGKVATSGALDVSAALDAAAAIADPSPPTSTAPPTTTVAPQPAPTPASLHVDSPNTTLTRWNATKVTLSWTGRGVANVAVTLVNATTGARTPVATGRPASGSLSWTVKVAAGRYLVEVSSGAVRDRSDAVFAVFNYLPGTTAPGRPRLAVANSGKGAVTATAVLSTVTGGPPLAFVTTVCARAGSPTKVGYSVNGRTTITGLQSGVVYGCTARATNGGGWTSGASTTFSIRTL